MKKKTLIELRDVAKHHKKDGEIVKAVDGINQEVPTTGMVAVVGPSGSGKSTLG
jgi:putative ABC transport system ATP-binding protein